MPVFIIFGFVVGIAVLLASAPLMYEQVVGVTDGFTFFGIITGYSMLSVFSGYVAVLLSLAIYLRVRFGSAGITYSPINEVQTFASWCHHSWRYFSTRGPVNGFRLMGFEFNLSGPFTEQSDKESQPN